MSVVIGASATGSRAYTATASQGLLYMAEAVFNAAGMGLPIVMTVANRAIGAPINIWNDHSDAMSHARLRLAAALRRRQPGGGGPARAGVPARRDALAAGDGLHGRLRAHPRLRGGRRPGAGAGRPRSCRRCGRSRCSTRPTRHDRRHGRAGGLHRGPLPGRTCGTARRSTLLGEVATDFEAAFGRPGARLVRPYRCADAATVVVALGSVLGTLADVVDERRDQRRQRRRLGITSFRPFPRPGGAGGAGRCRRGGRPRAVAALGEDGPVTADVARGTGREPGSRSSPSSRGSAAARSPRQPCTACSTGPSEASSGRLTFLDLDRDVVDRELARRGPADLSTVEVGP